jgi:ureidoacrylate peracid hydrolase
MKLEEKVHPSHTAVIVIDMQNDFCSEGGAMDKIGLGVGLGPIREMIPTLARFLDDARSAGVPVVYVQAVYNTDDNRYLSPVWLEHAERRRGGLYTEVPLCKEDSWGAEIVDELAPRPGEAVVRKHRYSAFIDTPLQALLRNRGAKTILVTGVGTNGCVESTARDGFMLDHYTVTIADCCTTYWPESHERSLKELDLLFGEVRTSDDVVGAWKRVLAPA